MIQSVVTKLQQMLRNPYFCFILGGFTAWALLVSTLLMPLMPVDIAIGTIVPKDGGPRLFVAGLHIHHYLFGLAAMGVAYLFHRTGMRNFSYFLFGFGAVLFIDEVPDLLSGEMDPFVLISNISKVIK